MKVITPEKVTTNTYPGDIPVHDFPYRWEDDPPFMIKQLNPDEPWLDPMPDRHTFYALFWITEGEGFHPTATRQTTSRRI